MTGPHPPGPTPPPLAFTGPIPSAELPLLCDRLGELLAGAGGAVVGCDVSRLAVSLESVDALARLQLAARRLGGRLALRGTTPELAELLGICGLAGVFPASAPSPPPAPPTARPAYRPTPPAPS